MEQRKHLIPEERVRLTEIQDSLIDRYVGEGNRCRAIKIEFEIKELLHEKRKLRSGRRKADIGDGANRQMYAQR